ncbi:MAG: YhcH/YjgK/YiaL family protein [Coprobacillaceae bacterium]
MGAGIQVCKVVDNVYTNCRKNNVENYAKQIDIVSNFISNIDFSNSILEQKVSISNDIFYIVKKYNPKHCAEIKLENHEILIDVHYALKGNEGVVIAKKEELDIISEYDSSTDCGWYTAKDDSVHSSVVIEEGIFLVLFPGEAHEPEILVNNEENMKVIFKIKK